MGRTRVRPYSFFRILLSKKFFHRKGAESAARHSRNQKPQYSDFRGHNMEVDVSSLRGSNATEAISSGELKMHTEIASLGSATLGPAALCSQ